MAEQKRGRGRPGRPPKCNKTDTSSIINKIEDQMQYVSANAADNLDKYFKEIDNVALNKSGKVNLKDQVGACKYMIEQAEKFLKDQKISKGVVADNTVDEEEEDAPLLSVVYNDK